MVVKIAEKCGSEFATTIQTEHYARELHNKTCTDLAKREKTKADTYVRDKYLAIIFILNINKNQFSKYKDDCSNSFQAHRKQG